MTITVGSLCSGAGMLDRSVSLALSEDVALRWQAEADPDMSGVLKRAHPGVPNVGDIKTAPWHLAPHVDLITSGDPCQTISAAGRQAGRADPRFLWPWVREIIRTVRPGVVFLENVANIVGHDGGRTLAERLTDLRSMGYACRWTIVGACAVGAPHHRHRWFLLASYVGDNAPEAVRVGVKAHCGAPRSGGRVLLPSPRTSDTNGAGVRGEGGLDLRTAVALLPTPVVRDGDGRGEGDERYWATRGETRSNGMPLGATVALLPTPRATDGTDGGPNCHGSKGDLIMPSACQPERWGKFAEAVALWESITGVPAPEPTVPGARGGRRLSPLLPEWMMGIPAGMLSDHLDRNAAIKGAGNSVVALAGAAAWRLLGGEDRA